MNYFLFKYNFKKMEKINFLKFVFIRIIEKKIDKRNNFFSFIIKIFIYLKFCQIFLTIRLLEIVIKEKKKLDLIVRYLKKISFSFFCILNKYLNIFK